MTPTYQSGFYAPGRGTAKYPSLWRGCVGAWNPSLGNSGLVLRDWSGRSNNGTLTNMDLSAAWQPGTLAFASTYPNATRVDFGIAKIGTLINGSGEVSLAMWLRCESLTAGFVAGEYSNVAWANRMFSDGSGTWVNVTGSSASVPGKVKIGGRSVSGDTFKEVTGATIVTVRRWFHVVGVVSYRTNTISVFVNGVRDGIASVSFGSSVYQASTGSLSDAIGSNLGNEPFFGNIDDVRVYTRAITQTEISLLAAQRGIAYELAPRKVYSLPATVSTRQYKLLRPSILRGA